MTQYGFFFDQSRCTGCHTCSIACKVWYDLPKGPLKYMRVYQWEKGTFPNIDIHILAIPCYHCENPACVDACPNGAIYKESKYGAVLIDEERCKGERKCWVACPYGSIAYPSDEPFEKAQKCTMCIDRLEQNMNPVCVMSCSLRALEFGPIDELKKKYGEIQQLADMPSPDEVRPSVVMKPADGKKKLVPYDANKALKLWKQRGPFAAPGLPDVFESESDITDVEAVSIGLEKLVLKPKSVKELMYYTADFE